MSLSPIRSGASSFPSLLQENKSPEKPNFDFFRAFKLFIPPTGEKNPLGKNRQPVTLSPKKDDTGRFPMVTGSPQTSPSKGSPRPTNSRRRLFGGTKREPSCPLSRSAKRVRLNERPNNWVSKKPRIFSDMIEIGSHTYPAKKIGAGAEHWVYSINSTETITFQTTNGPVAVKANTVVLKTLNSLRVTGERKRKNLFNQSIKAYERLQLEGINLPRVHVRPDTHVGSEGGYWVIENLATECEPEEWKNQKFEALSATNQKILNFVKGILTREAKEEKIIVGDFYPRTVMISSEKKPCVIDFAPIKKNWEKEVFSNLIAWANQSRDIFNHLISDFPKEAHKTMLTKLPKSGEVPESEQTYHNFSSSACVLRR